MLARYTHDFIELFNRGTRLSRWPVGRCSTQVQPVPATFEFSSIEQLPVRSRPASIFLFKKQPVHPWIASLPTPDVTDSTPIDMAARWQGGAGQYNDTSRLQWGSTPCSPAQSAPIVDLIGWDGANFFEGSGPGPTTTNTTAALGRKWLCRNRQQAADFAAGAPLHAILLHR